MSDSYPDEYTQEIARMNNDPQLWVNAFGLEAATERLSRYMKDSNYEDVRNLTRVLIRTYLEYATRGQDTGYTFIPARKDWKP